MPIPATWPEKASAARAATSAASALETMTPEERSARQKSFENRGVQAHGRAPGEGTSRASQVKAGGKWRGPPEETPHAPLLEIESRVRNRQATMSLAPRT